LIGRIPVFIGMLSLVFIQLIGRVVRKIMKVMVNREIVEDIGDAENTTPQVQGLL